MINNEIYRNNKCILKYAQDIYIKILNLKKEVWIAIKSKETSSQLELVRNRYVTILHQPVNVSSNTCSQMHVQIKYSLVHPQDLIPTLAGIKYSYK